MTLTCLERFLISIHRELFRCAVFLGLGRVIHFKSEIRQRAHLGTIKTRKNIPRLVDEFAQHRRQVIAALNKLLHVPRKFLDLFIYIAGFFDLRRNGLPIEQF